MLLDFGAARQIIERRTAAPTAILKPNFAPIEQYGDAGAVSQGPWSDVYSLAAVLHYCLIGRAPVPATARVLQDELPRLLDLRDELVASDGSRYSADFLAAIDAALSLLPEGRPQTAAQFRARLHGELMPAAVAAATAPPALPANAPVPAMTYLPTTAVARNVVPDAAVGEPPGPLLEPVAGSAISAAAPSSAPAPAVVQRRWPARAAAVVIAAVAAIVAGQALRPSEPRAMAVESLSLPAMPAAAARSTPTGTGTSAAARPHSQSERRATANAVPPAAPAPRTAKPGPSATRAATVRGICGDRSFMARQVCTFRQCRKPEFAGDPDCASHSPQDNEPAGYGS